MCCLIYCYAECRYAECRYAECRGARKSLIPESRQIKEEEKKQYAHQCDEQKSGQYSYAVSGFWPGVNTIKLFYIFAINDVRQNTFIFRQVQCL